MLKAVVTSLDDVQEEFRSLYSEQGDNHVLQIEGADGLPDVKNLKNAYEKEKAKRQELSAKRDELEALMKGVPEDFDMGVWEKAKKGEVDQAAIEDATVKLRNTLEAERDEWKTKYEDTVKEGRRTAANMELSEALTKAGVADGPFLEASRAMLAPKVDFSDDGKPRVQSEMGPMSIPEYVERWAKSDGKAFVKPPSGGGQDTTTTTTPPVNNPNDATKGLVGKIPGLADLPVR